MNKYSIENFIDFCDELQINDIATEGLKDVGKSMWEAIKRIFRKIVTWFQNILRSINYFKNATLDDQLNKDLVTVLKIAQPKTELNFNWINYYYKMAAVIGKGSNGQHNVPGMVFGDVSMFGNINGNITTVEDQIKRCVYDIDSSLKAAEESSAKKRIDANEYKNENMVTIPMAQITSDLNKSYSKATAAETNLSKLENACTKLAVNTKGKELVSKAHVFYQKLSQYYRFRIELLSKFLNYAKASLKGTISNVKDAVNSKDRLRTNFKPSINQKMTFKSKAQVDEILDLYTQAINAKTYEEYKPIYTKLTNLLKIEGCCIERITKVSDISIQIVYVKEGISYPIGNQKLYHHSYGATDIKELEPRWKTANNVLYATPRVYFHIGIPLNRYANKLTKDNTNNTLFTPTIKIDKVFVDKELSRTACYVETTKPIPVKPVDYSEWEKTKDVELGFDTK